MQNTEREIKTMPKNKVTTEQLSKLLNNIRVAIDDSDFGPVYIYGGTPEEPKKIMSPAAFQLYSVTLSAFISKIDIIDLVRENQPSNIEL